MNKAGKISAAAAILILSAFMLQYQNCASGGGGGAFNLGNGASTGPTPVGGATPTPTPPTPSDNSTASQFYVKLPGTNTIVVDSDVNLKGPLTNNGNGYFAKAKFINTGTTTWDPAKYKVVI